MYSKIPVTQADLTIQISPKQYLTNEMPRNMNKMYNEQKVVLHAEMSIL